jgi:hypothetical protein
MNKLMLYLLGLEVWQSPEKIFLNQGMYAVEILKMFDMLECKSMNAPMETKLNLLIDTSLELVDATMYINIIELVLCDEYPDGYMFFCKHILLSIWYNRVTLLL